MGYGLGLSNVTNLNKAKPATLSQQGAFTVVSPKGSMSMAKTLDVNENLVITGFCFIGIRRHWKYRLIMWLSKKFAR